MFEQCLKMFKHIQQAPNRLILLGFGQGMTKILT